MVMDKVCACLDMDAFFASVEQRDNPRLKGKAVIVGTGARSVVAAASYEARPFGIHSGMPTAQAKQLCPHAIFLPGRHGVYSRVSREIFEFLNRFSPVVDQASIDEAYLDLTGCSHIFGPPLEHAQKIQEAVEQNFHLTCSLGLGPNPLIAKMASGFKKPRGLTMFATEQEARKAFAPLPVDNLIGVGPKMRDHLNRLGIMTIGDLAKTPLPRLQKDFGVVSRSLIRTAQGYAEGGWWQKRGESGPQSISHCLTFEKDTRDPDFLKKVFLLLSEQVARRVREAGLAAGSLTLTLRFPDFKTITRQAKLAGPTSDPQIFYKKALEIYNRQGLNNRLLRLVGVAVHGLDPSQQLRQMDLFQEKSAPKNKLLAAMDQLRKKYGDEIVGWASLKEQHFRH